MSTIVNIGGFEIKNLITTSSLNEFTSSFLIETSSYSLISEYSNNIPLHTHSLNQIESGGATSQQVLMWNGSSWIPQTISGTSGSYNININSSSIQLSNTRTVYVYTGSVNVTLPTTPSINDFLEIIYTGNENLYILSGDNNQIIGSSSYGGPSGSIQMYLNSNTGILLFYEGSYNWNFFIINGNYHIVRFYYKNDNHGYISGALPLSANVDKISYNTKTTVSQLSANLSVSKRTGGTYGNKINGYNAGGYTTVGIVTSDKFNFSTDTTVATPSSNLSLARWVLGGAGSVDHGYFSGGNVGTSTNVTDRVTSATDITVPVISANLTGLREGMASTSSGTRVYYTAGYSSTNNLTTTFVDRIEISTETTIAINNFDSAGGTARNVSTGIGNTEYGYVTGGSFSSTILNTTFKQTYSTETYVAVPSANISVGRYGMAGTGNTIIGFVTAGALKPSDEEQSLTNSITYSTDTSIVEASAASTYVRTWVGGV